MRKSGPFTWRSLAASAAVFIFLLTISPPASSQSAPVPKKPVTYDIYDSWRSIRGTQISPDGEWLAYSLVPQDGDGELVVRNLNTGAEFRTPRGNSPVITADGKYVVFAVAALKAEVDKAKKEKKKPEEQPKSGLGIMDLATGEVKTVERVKSFKVPEEGSSHIAYIMEAPPKTPEEKAEEEKEAEEEKKSEEKKASEEKKGETPEGKKKKERKKEPGTDLVIRELVTAQEVTIPEVVEYTWNRDGTQLSWAVSSKTPENDSAFVRRMADGQLISLLQGLGHYKGFTFDESGKQLAFVSDRDSYKEEAPAFKLYHWTGSDQAASELVPAKAKGLAPGWAVSEHGQIEFSKDGERLFFGTAPAPQADPEDAPDPIKVDIWHWKDPELQPMQKVRADDEKKRSCRAVIHLKAGGKTAAPKFVQLAVPDLPEIALSDDAKLALGSTDLPYRRLISWDRRYTDTYLVNLLDGSSKKILDKSPFRVDISPGAKYLLYFDDADKQWHSYRVADGKRFNLTAGLGVRFENEEWDTPGEPYPYGSAGWVEGERSVLIYDRYDIWEIKPDGSSARMVTEGIGRRDRIIFRDLRLDPEEKAIPAKEPRLVSARDDKTKASGFYRVNLAAVESPIALIMLDKSLGGLQKAKKVDVYVFTEQRFNEFPDLWLSGPDFKEPEKITAANPQQREFNWGTAELIEYTNADGKILPAVLIKPEDFDPSKKYPLMVYIYEKLSNALHRHIPPSPGTGINFTRYASNGYVILMPDIIYETGYPGESCYKCVIPAVNHVLGQGYIDPERLGIQGHSWGGYQISYLITRTDMFAAVQAGASVVNMVSAYGGIRWGSGMSRAFQYEKTQSRIGGPPWIRTLQFIENSPLFWVEKVTTPYLTIHNDEDDAVPWYQAIEFFTALRRLDKEAYLFNYNGEKHGLRERENQKHWTVHMDEFFDHYLKEAPKPEWMEKGVSYLERGKRDIDSLFKKKE
ncbi:MAG: prolyl oligopeptidase family serine peptidase [Candidatus Aminicenantales bacterium]